MSIVRERFGVLGDGREVDRYVLENENGMKVAILTLGGAIQQILVPDRNGKVEDVICGFDTLESYVSCPGQHGALIGRFGNRIARGKFTLDGVTYTLATNNGVNHLHGGKEGYHCRVWDAEAQDGAEPALALSYVSPDGEEGYPGMLRVCVTYTLTKKNAISIRYVATTDKKTVLNLTNHAYFNLGGIASGSTLSHRLTLDADTYLPVDETKIPLGVKVSVEGTPFDFREERAIGEGCPDGVYDHCFNFAGGETAAPVWRGTLYEPVSGREMKMYTNQPSVQLYTGNHLGDPKFPFKGGVAQVPYGGVCLETQKAPDAPNQPHLANAELCPGEVYDYTTVYEFSVRS